jgi:voltage-gated potassium channel
MFTRIANSPRLLVLAALLILLAASVSFELAEHRGAWDSIYWAIITATTVGYGDAFPTTTAGRVVAICLVSSMVLFFIPMVTASFASKLIVDRDAFTHEEQEEMKEGIALILQKLGEDWHPSAPPTRHTTE